MTHFQFESVTIFMLVLVSLKTLSAECPNCLNENCNSEGECLSGCVAGFVDIYCNEQCPPNCVDGICHIDRRKGIIACSEGCRDGYCGVRCKRQCPDNCTTCDRSTCSVCNVKPCSQGRYGPGCSGTCNPNYEICDKDTGECIKCRSGYYGDTCEKSCPSCLFLKEEHQLVCLSGCEICQADSCPPGFYGRKCNMTCSEYCFNGACKRESGTCNEGCVKGYKNIPSGCEKQPTGNDNGGINWKLPVIIVSCGIILCIAVCVPVVFCLCKRRRKRRSTQEKGRENEPFITLRVDDPALALSNKTEREIELRTNGMVRVSTVDTVIKKLEAGSRWITITGNPGDGKTTLGYLVLREYQGKMKVYKLDTPEDYYCLSQKEDRIIFLDDIFGTFTSDTTAIKRWLPLVRKLLEEHDKSTEETHNWIILTSRRNVVVEAQGYLERYRNKMLDFIVDLKIIKNPDERLQILECHLQKNNVDVDSDEQKNKVADLDTPQGFPLCCKTYSELRGEGKRIDMVKFFTYPLIVLNETTRALLKEPGYRSLFLNMIKHDGEFNINMVTDDNERRVMLEAAASQEDSYIHKDTDSVCHFTYPAMYESVLRVIANEDPVFIVKFASLPVLLEKFTFSDIPDESVRKSIFIPPLPVIRKTLAERFRQQILDGDCDIFGARLSFNTEFCEELVTLCVHSDPSSMSDKETQYINFQNTSGATMLTTAAMHGNVSAVNVLLSKGADVNQTDGRRMTALHYLCGPKEDVEEKPKFKNTGCIRQVLEKGADVNIQNAEGLTPLDILRDQYPDESEAIELLERASRK